MLTVLSQAKALIRWIREESHAESQREASASQEQGEAERIISAVEQSRDAILSEHRTNRTQNERENRFNRRIAVATLLVVSIYSFVAFLQYRNMQESLKHTRDALHITERAYVNFGFSGGKFMRLFPLEVGKPIMVAANLQNSGRLPATRVVVNYGISRPIKVGANQTLQSPFWHHITSCDPSRDDLSKHPDWVESIIPANATEMRYLFVPTDRLARADIDTIK